MAKAGTPDNASSEALHRFGADSLASVLEAFAAGKEVPGSGSANALCAALGACLTASVALKTAKSDKLKYLPVKQTSADVERQARKIAAQLQELLDHDSAAFAPVIAIRRETGRESDKYRQDQALRKEVAALKPATEIPLQIATLANRVGELALTMLDSGFEPARGESYTALSQAIAALDGALFVARLNIKTIRQKTAKLNDPLLEGDWVKRALLRVAEIREQAKTLRVRASMADTALDSSFQATPAKRRRTKHD